jgi:hypothetical protein
VIQRFADPRHLAAAGRHREIIRASQDCRQWKGPDFAGRPADLVETGS